MRKRTFLIWNREKLRGKEEEDSIAAFEIESCEEPKKERRTKKGCVLSRKQSSSALRVAVALSLMIIVIIRKGMKQWKSYRSLNMVNIYQLKLGGHGKGEKVEKERRKQCVDEWEGLPLSSAGQARTG
uniref:Transmembrane protein n=1 Tax=Caenorhabditis tropicalis TaxID=1561998 RepID=A0A1I7T122_9PELO